MMIAMVGRMFFAAPQIASADNNSVNASGMEWVVVYDRDLKVTFIYVYQDGDCIGLSVIDKNGNVKELISMPSSSGN